MLAKVVCIMQKVMHPTLQGLMGETAVPRVSMHVPVFMMTHNVKMHHNVHWVQSRTAMDARTFTCVCVCSRALCKLVARIMEITSVHTPGSPH